MAKQKKTNLTPPATSRRYRYKGQFCIKLVLRAPSETIWPAKMTDDDIDAFLIRRPSGAQYFEKIE